MILMLQKQKIQFFLSIISGLTGIFSFSPYNFWPAALISVFGLLFLNINSKLKQSILNSLLWSISFFGSGISWVYISLSSFNQISTYINIILIVLLILYLSIYPILFSIIQKYFIFQKEFLCLVIFSPSIWQVTEFFRGILFTGFPWLQFGYTQINGPLKYLAPILGVEFITFILIMISGLLVYSIIKKMFFPFFLATFLLFFPYIFLNKIKWYEIQKKKYINITLIQGNISPFTKWKKNKIIKNLAIYYNLSYPFLKNSNILIWPESAISDFEHNQQKFIKKLDCILKIKKVYLFTGSIYLDLRNYKYYNSIVLFGKKNYYNYFNSFRYKKNHLVPFGEFIPFAKNLRSIILFFNLPMSSFSKGLYHQNIIKTINYNFTPTICYEIIDNQQIRKNFHIATDFLLNISNDAWFGNSIGPWQHFQMSRMRALEFGRPLIRSSNTGLTGIVKANGNVEVILPQFSSTALTFKLFPTLGFTPYINFGNSLSWFLTLFFMAYTILRKFLTY